MTISTGSIRRDPPVLTIVCCLLLSLALSGCGLTKAQKDGVATFGQAAGTLGRLSADQLRAGRASVIEMKKLSLALEKKQLPAKKPDGTPPDRAFYQELINIDSGLDPASMAKRTQAVELLVAYGDLLVAFADKNQDRELDEAADKFVSSLKKFPDNPLDEEKINGLGKLVAVAGKVWIEHEKREALREIVPTASPLVQRLCDSLEKEFDIRGMHIATNIDLVQQRLASEALDGLKREPGSISDQYLLIRSFTLANDTRDAVRAVADKGLKAVAALREADRMLVDLVTSRKFTIDKIKSFARDVNDLQRTLKPFYH